MTHTDIEESSVSIQVTPFIKLLDTYILGVEKSDSAEDIIEVITYDFVLLAKAYLELGGSVLAQLQDTAVSPLAYLVHYALPNPFKDIALINRDVYLQLQIAAHKRLERPIAEDILQHHFLASKNTLLDATDFFKNQFEKNLLQTERFGDKNDKTAVTIKHYQNPWETYAAQFRLVLEQCKAIGASAAIISEATAVFAEVDVYVKRAVELRLMACDGVSGQLNNMIVEIQNYDPEQQVETAVQSLRKIEVHLDRVFNDQEEFTQTIARITSRLSKGDIPVGTEEGILIEKRVNYAKAVKKWLDYHILPKITEIWKHEADLVSFAKHSVLNLKGNLVLSKTQKPISEQFLDTIKERIVQVLQMQKDLSIALNKRLDSQFFATAVYEDAEFLEVSLQTSLTHYKSDSNDRFTHFVQRGRLFFENLNSTYGRVLSHKQPTRLGNASECIANRMLKEEHAQYDMFFLNKNFLGDLFLANRTVEEKDFENAIRYWRSGAFTAILLKGHRLCGKTTFIHKMVKKNLRKEVVFLTPNTKISFHGRTFDTGVVLKQVFNEIKKASFHTKTVLVIDDLELWQDRDTSLIENVRELSKFIESDVENILIVATIGTIMQEQLEKRMSFSNYFTALIDLNTSTSKEIFEAVRLRHAASNLQLVNDKKEIYTIADVEKKVLNLCKTYEYNLGEVLQAWTYGTALVSSHEVKYEEPTEFFTDFFTAQEAIILKYVLMNKGIEELTLKRFIGKRYDAGYASGLKRLSNIKVLVRDAQGSLSLNPVVLFEVHQILAYRGILS